MRVAVVLSTYNQPEYLRLVLEGYARQERRPDRILVADDGSTGATAGMLDTAAQETGLSLLHIWHPDRGFRKTEILNHALRLAEEEVLIFSDGDCIPRRDFVSGHLTLTRTGFFVSGGYLKLPARTTAHVTLDAIASGDLFRSRWLRSHGWSPGHRALRLLSHEPVAHALDRLTPTKPTWNGHNASAPRKHLVEVNGFDLDMHYGGEDRVLGDRLRNSGISGIQARHRLPVVHLDHGRPYLDREVLRENHLRRMRVLKERELRAPIGLEETENFAEVVTRSLVG
jgi:glycosyltransferase involved in cell wall biosynthesis